jgi:hypothetical protein
MVVCALLYGFIVVEYSGLTTSGGLGARDQELMAPHPIP